MQKFIKLSDNSVVDAASVITARYPHAIGQPSGWDDDQLAVWGFAQIEPAQPPEIFPGQMLVSIAPALVNGVWVQQWRVDEPSPESLAALKTDRHRQINAQRDEMLSSELLFLTTGGGNVWQFNKSSLTVLTETLLMYSINPAFLPPLWRDANNINHPCNIGLLTTIAGVYQAYKAEIYTASWMMKAVVDNESTATAEAIAAVHWSDFLTPNSAAAALACIE